jgi:hypothetical protein
MTIRIPPARCVNQHRVGRFIFERGPKSKASILQFMRRHCADFSVHEVVKKMIGLGLIEEFGGLLYICEELKTHYTDIDAARSAQQAVITPPRTFVRSGTLDCKALYAGALGRIGTLRSPLNMGNP